MNKIISFLETYAPSVLRYSVSAVILWFGLAQLINADIFTSYIPDSVVAMTHLSATFLVYCNAVFELIFGIMLVFGWKTRISAFLLALHLFDIMYVVGYGEVGVRDFGLSFATLVVFMNGADVLSIEGKKEKEVLPQSSEEPLKQIKKII